MANAFKHKRTFKVVNKTDGTDEMEFTSTADANTKIGFTSVWNTSSPTKTESLEDNGYTLAVTYEFDSEEDQTAFNNAVNVEWPGQFTPQDSNYFAAELQHIWYAEDGTTVGHTTNIS